MQEYLPKLYKYCAYQDRCRSEIEKKMRDLEVPRADWEDILAHLENERFWNEERFARIFTRGKFNHKRWGKQKIRHALRQKKVPSTLIEIALEEEIPQEDYEKTFDRISEKKLKELTKESPKQKRVKLTRFLQQRGFEWEIIQKRIGLLLTVLCFFSLFWVRCTQPQKAQYAAHDPNTEYVGIATCRGCHQNIYKNYSQTGMGRSLYPPDPRQNIERFGEKETVYDPAKDFYYYAYWEDELLYMKEYRLRGTDTVYKRIEGVDFIVGSGHQTRSYLMERNNYWYEMPITWYVDKQIWDLSPGYEVNNARFSREIGQECLGCHTGKTHFVEGSKNRFHNVAHGIDCEKCHGPGSVHVEMARTGQLTDEGIEYSIVNPDDLAIQEQFDVCQQCHLQGVNVYHDNQSIADFRPSQPLAKVMDVFIEAQEDANAFGIASHAERLQASQCFIQSDGKLNCTTCHNPHKSISVTDPKRYTRQCSNCHQAEQSPVCSASSELQMTMEGDCISCHMPKGGTRDIPHVSFHDHKIRIVNEKDTVDVAAVKDFLRIQAATRKQLPDSIWGQAWLLYYERHERKAEHLNKAVAALVNGPAYPKAQAALYQGKAQQALQFLAPALKGDNPSSLAIFLQGEILEQLGQFGKAMTAYDKAYQLAPESVEAELKAVNMLLRSRQGDATILPIAAQRLEALLERKPFDERLLTNLAFVKVNQGYLQEGKALLEKALSYDPDYKIAIDNLALVNSLL